MGLSLILFNVYQKDDSLKRFDVILASFHVVKAFVSY